MSLALENGMMQRTHALGIALSSLTSWLDDTHLYPMPEEARLALVRKSQDLDSRVKQLQSEPTLLTVAFVGGTGVGKSSLLNAFAGSKVADSGLARPTTRVPTVYHHERVTLHRLPPIFSRCKLVPHDREELRYKVLIDTPDLDGSETENHERVREMIPNADLVIYVGSQEKYHDQEMWRMLLEQRGSRGFAFVLNKWDRCLASGTNESVRPDEDFARSLRSAGFDSPMIFRTCANQWAKRRAEKNTTLPEPTDDFQKLETWLENELDGRAIRDIKMKGIVGSLDELIPSLEEVIPPSWDSKRDRLRRQWDEAMREAMADQTTILVEAADDQAAQFEKHFSRIGRSHISGIFGGYLKLVDAVTKFSVSLIPNMERNSSAKMEEMAGKAMARIAPETHEMRRDALKTRLLALAAADDWPIEPLARLLPDTKVQRLDERALSSVLAGELKALEQDLAQPRGTRFAARWVISALCAWGPTVAAGTLLLKWLWDLWQFQFWGLSGYLAATTFLALVFAALHLLLIRLVPVRWDLLRGRFRRMVEDRLLENVAPGYFRAIDEFTKKINEERKVAVETLGVMKNVAQKLSTNESVSAASDVFADVDSTRR